jgi:hypothetical protein
VQEVSLDNSIKLTTAGILYADSSLAIWNASKFLGRSLSPTAPTSGQILKWNGATWAPAADDNTGLTSVGLTMPSIFSVANSPLTANGTIATTLATQTANTLFAGPGTGVAATPTFRAMVTADIPDQGVTYTKIQNVTTQKLLGRYTAGTGTVQEVTLDNSIKLTAAGTLYADSSLAIWNASELQGRRISGVAPTDNYILRWDAGTSTWGPEAETSASNWLFTGNSNTTATSFLGTTVDQPMVLKYNNNELFRGTKGAGVYASKTVSLFNGATAYNGHPVVIKANGPDVLAFQDSTGTLVWHWNLLGPGATTGLNFVESNVADYRLFLKPGGNVGINTGTPAAMLDVMGTVKVGVAGTPLNSILRIPNVSMTVTNVNNTTFKTVTLTGAAYSAVLANATIIVNPQSDLPTGVAIASARSIAGTIYVKFINTTTNQSFTYNFDITVIQ